MLFYLYLWVNLYLLMFVVWNVQCNVHRTEHIFLGSKGCIWVPFVLRNVIRHYLVLEISLVSILAIHNQTWNATLIFVPVLENRLWCYVIMCRRERRSLSVTALEILCSPDLKGNSCNSFEKKLEQIQY